jgi:hypothetical protein
MEESVFRRLCLDIGELSWRFRFVTDEGAEVDAAVAASFLPTA